MNIAKEQAAIEAALDQYRSWLDEIPDEQFTQTPPMGGWSYAEVYSHILKANQLSGITIDKCNHRNCEATTKGRSLLTRLVFGLNLFPPVKFKVPRKIEDRFPILKISKEEAKNLLIKCRKQIADLTPEIDESSPFKIKHPRLGMLNAADWLKFIRIHTEHHLKQLKRIENNFNRR